MLNWLNKFIPFHAFAREGKFYFRRFWFLPSKEISKEKFEEILETKKITEMTFKVAPGKIGEMLSGIVNDIKEFREQGHSPYGERVVLIPIKIQEDFTKEGINMRGKWRCETESGEYIKDVTFNIGELTGPSVDRGAKPSEWIPAMLQLQMSGASATEDDFAAFRRAFKVEEKEEEATSDELREQQEGV